MTAMAFQAFTRGLPFALSAYQDEALAALTTPGVSVVLVAPTGSGKSVVADAAIWQAVEMGGTAAYTSPLRALANQRFAQLEACWGARAGLITGDTVVRPGASVRVMTAEVYRTLALLPDEAPERVVARSSASGAPAGAASAAWAIFDEAHYLADPQRGSAWEEAILATPPETRILCLSATIGAPERLAGWLRWLGRDVALIHVPETARPVPLRHFLALRGDLHLVLDEHGRRHGSFPMAGGWALAQRRPAHLRGGPMAKRGRPAPLPGLPSVPPAEWIRQETLGALRLLREREMTPAIAYAGGRREAELLAEAAQRAFPEAAEGVAFHHAGLPPAARQRVEERLAAGELWLVCGTTTLAAGLDVPVRSVLVTSFGHFDGRAFRLFSPAEYRQLGGRAGRLGKDEAGAVVLLASPWHGFEEAFRKLTAPLPPLESAFRPGYATALAWWGTHGESALAAMLASTFGSYLRRVGQARGKEVAPRGEPDGQSVLQARAMGRLLVEDGLVDETGTPTARGQFVLHAGGQAEGRLLLRLVEMGAFAALDGAGRLALLGAVAEGPAPGEREAVLEALRAAHREQVALERRCGALLTPPLAQPGPNAPLPDPWRRRQAVADLLERAQRAAKRSGAGTTVLELAADGPDPRADT